MASWFEGVFELDFVDPEAAKEFTCSVCLSLAVQPRLNPSCGHHYCHLCTEKLISQGQPCPECRAAISNPVPDLYFERKMRQLKVNCAFCNDWAGQFGELDGHLGQCPLQPVDCDFRHAGCRAKVPHRDLDRHMQESLAAHLGLLCKHGQHKDDEIIALKAESQALKEKVETADRKIKAAEEKIQNLENQLASTCAIATPEFVMTSFREHQLKDDDWFTPPFYSHVGGYKISLRVRANGRASGVGTHVSVDLYLMWGENDDHLKWPFRGDITVQLINHREDKSHIEKVIDITDRVPDTVAGRVVSRMYSSSAQGYEKFIAHSDLPYNSAKNTEYLWNHSLTFRVTTKNTLR